MAQEDKAASLIAASSPEELLRQLKDLKNSVIGNTWKKVEVAEDAQLLSFLLSQLGPGPVDAVRAEIIIETAVILGALATVGPLTIRSLLYAGLPAVVLSHIRALISTNGLPSAQLNRLLPPLLRALRNTLVTTADIVWGHMWGVGAEKKVVGTGLVSEDVFGEGAMKSKVHVRGRNWRAEAKRALSLCFEQGNLNTLMVLVQRYPDNAVLLPLYQLFARLIALPSHRDALIHWRGAAPPAAGPSSHRLDAWSAPFILEHLLATISLSWASPSRKANGKLLEAGLDLLAVLVKGHEDLGGSIRAWNDEVSQIIRTPSMDNDYPLPRFVSLLVDMLLGGPTPVRIASANCLTSVLKGDPNPKAFQKIRTSVMNMQVLEVTVKLIKSEGLEDKIKLCFVLAALVNDDGPLQKRAGDQGCARHLIDTLIEVRRDEEAGRIGGDLSARCQEAMLLAIAAMSFIHEETRGQLAETQPPFLPVLLKTLSHPSYGVRAAACQVARALSRTIAILRTSLMDSGVGQEVVQLLRREIEARQNRKASPDPDMELEEEFGDRAFTVEVAATAAICNLIADFSPLKAASWTPPCKDYQLTVQKMVDDGSVEMLAKLIDSPYEPLALNALWAIKNLTFRAGDPLKVKVMDILGWNTLRVLVCPSTSKVLRVQALEITQNILADALPLEISRAMEAFGEDELLDLLTLAAKADQQPEMRIPALYSLANLGLGNDRTRSLIVSKVETLEVLSEGVNAKQDAIKIPAIRSIRHLVESNAKTHRPRQAILDLFQPYQLKPRLKTLAECSANLDVCQGAMGLLEVLDRSRDGGVAPVGSVPR